MAEEAGVEERVRHVLQANRPSVWENMTFWASYVLSWMLYLVLTIIYLPWAAAMHVIILALLIVSLPSLYWRVPRKIHLYIYVVLVMVPGKFLWYNLFRYNKRRGQVWDYEMGKPKPVEVERRRRISTDDKVEINPQVESPLFTRLPPEIRLRIYKHTIMGDSRWFRIKGWPETEPKRSKDIKVRAYPCLFPTWDLEDAADSTDLTIQRLYLSICMQMTKKNNQMGVQLLQTCRKIYDEAIKLFYTLPDFCFMDLHRPPYFLRTVLPSRLALIRSIHVVYDQKKMLRYSNHVGCSTARFHHRIGQCAFCNPIQWFNGFKQYMTGLEHIHVLIFLKKDQRIPGLSETWIARMLDLQTGPNGIRRMTVDVKPDVPNDDSGGDLTDDEEEYATQVRQFKEQLQKRLKREVDRYRARQNLDVALYRGSDSHSVKVTEVANESSTVPQDNTTGVG